MFGLYFISWNNSVGLYHHEECFSASLFNSVYVVSHTVFNKLFKVFSKEYENLIIIIFF